jgi:mannitol 2-dehydrogenase
VQNYLQDAWPVTVNLYTMAVEDFSNGRPEFESRVQTGRCKGPMKKWNPLTNAGHSVLGLLEPFMAPTINACMEDETFRNLLLWIQSYVISYDEGINLADYKDILLWQRFANPNIKDSVGRICSESSAKLTTQLLPYMRIWRQWKYWIWQHWLIAAWCYYSDKGMDNKGIPLKLIRCE